MRNRLLIVVASKMSNRNANTEAALAPRTLESKKKLVCHTGAIVLRRNLRVAFINACLQRRSLVDSLKLNCKVT